MEMLLCMPLFMCSDASKVFLCHRHQHARCVAMIHHSLSLHCRRGAIRQRWDVSCIFLHIFMLTELIVPARLVPFFRPDLKGKKSNRFRVSRQPGLFPHARLFSSVHGRNGMVARGGGRSLSPPPRSRPRPLGHRGDGDRRGREENELVREQMEQRWPRATPSIKRL